jgi:hypothetical protein
MATAVRGTRRAFIDGQSRQPDGARSFFPSGVSRSFLLGRLELKKPKVQFNISRFLLTYAPPAWQSLWRFKLQTAGKTMCPYDKGYDLTISGGFGGL